MEPFLTLDETSIDKNLTASSREGYTTRRAARAVLIDPEGRVGLLHVTRDHYYKLPGGGVDEGEELLEALERELLEETGCHAHIVQELGTVLEQRYYWNMTQISHCFIARQRGNIGVPDFTETEKEGGFELVWAKDLDEAIRLLESSEKTGDSREPGIKFMRLRDVAIGKRAKELLATNPL